MAHTETRMNNLKGFLFTGILIIFFLGFFIPSTPRADIYMYVDEDGSYYFTDTPTSSKYRLFLKERKPPPSKSYGTSRYDEIIQEASKRFGVEFRLLKAIIKVESNFNPTAVSKKGAAGLMQIMPGNFEDFQIWNPFDPWENIMGGTRYIKQLIDQFDGKLELALAAYNAGPNNINRAQGIPAIKETENFVTRVMKYYRQGKTGHYHANDSIKGGSELSETHRPRRVLP